MSGLREERRRCRVGVCWPPRWCWPAAPGRRGDPTPGVTLAPPTPAGMDEAAHRARRRATDVRGRLQLHREPAPVRQQGPGRRRRRHHPQPRHGSSSVWTSAATCSASATRSPARSPASTSTSQARSRATSSARPSQVEYRILSSADRIAALQNNQVDIVVKTMSITCERKKLVDVLDRVPLRQPADPRATRLDDRAGRPTCPASGCAP